MLYRERELILEKNYDQLPSNTRFVSNYTPSVSEITWLVPEKVKRRLKLNSLGVNGLATTIVAPDKTKDVDALFLQDTIRFSMEVNHKIGLPDTDDLIIRTAASNTKRKFSEISLLASDIHSHPKFQLQQESQRTLINTPSDFIALLDPETYLLIHDDNVDLQKKSLQGRIGRTSDGGYEIMVATGILHPRNIGENKPTYPLIRLTAYYEEDFEELNIYQIAKHFETNSTIALPRMEILSRNCDQRKANLMLTKLARDYLMLKAIKEKALREFGETSVLEFRSYDLQDGGIGQKIHALDVDY